MIQMYNIVMPHFFMNFIYHKSAGSKHSFFMSNVPGFLKPVYYNNTPVKRFFSILSGCGNITTAIGIVSMPEIA